MELYKCRWLKTPQSHCRVLPLCSASGVTSLALVALHQLLWACVCISSHLPGQWFHGGVTPWNRPSGNISPGNLQMLFSQGSFSYPLLKSWLLILYEHSIGFSLNLILNADNSVGWSYLLSFKSGSPRHFGKALSA